jgi:pimeloyl-ACP methyl ester carboxylesterase
MRATVAIAIIFAAILGFGITATSTAAAPEATFESAPCPMPIPIGQEPEDVECGYLTVPANRALDDDRTLRLAVAVLKATGDDPEPDPLVFLSGGPDAPSLPFMWSSQFAAPVQESRDIVFFDQRGSGYSTPLLDCPEFDTIENFEDARHACAVRHQQEGVNFLDYNTVEAMADLVDLMDVLDYESYNLYGTSYGTISALTALREAPDRIRSVVLDSVLPLESDIYIEQATAFDGALDVPSATAPPMPRATPPIRRWSRRSGTAPSCGSTRRPLISSSRIWTHQNRSR